ncbi:MAG TPA: glycosyltransferase family 4 protein [Patescibacteria group bacterium]|nr:glycosyltransferase family 4 protein [Patescibacteria group bacterium]
MKILLVSPSVPNRFHRIRLQHIMDALSDEHEITGVFLQCGKTPFESASSTRNYVFVKPKIVSLLDCLFQLPFPWPLEVAYTSYPPMKRLITSLAQSQDVILVKRLRAAQFIHRGVSTPVVLDATDAMSLYYKKASESIRFWRNPLFVEEWLKYLVYEKSLSSRFKHWVVSSPTDASYLEHVLPKETRISVIPNVVDTRYYQSSIPPVRPKRILFSGLLDKYVNKSAISFFLSLVFPLILKECPDVSLDIVGPNPPSRLYSIHDEHVSVTGTVPDIRDYISRSSVVVAPILVGTGTRNKVLQAWSHERPVVSTTIGAQGLGAEHRKHLFLADDPKSFASFVVDLLKDDHLAQKVGSQGRLFAEQHYSLSVMRDKYTALLQKVKNE